MPERPDRAAQHDLLGDHIPRVARMNLRDADDAGVLRMEIARHDRLQRMDRMRGEEHRILALIGHRGVRTLAGRDDFKNVICAHQRSRAHRERAGRKPRPIVHAEYRASRKAFEQSLLHHHAAATLVLLRRLKNEIRGAVEIAPDAQRLRRGEQHRRVAIVAAGVHPAWIARNVGDAGLLVDVQSVEIGAQRDRVRAVARTQDADDAGLRKPRMNLEAERVELVRDECAGRDFLECGFGICVQVMAPCAHVDVERSDFGDDVHGIAGPRVGVDRNPSGRIPAREIAWTTGPTTCW